MGERPSLLLTASALLYFAAALPLLFAPQELLAAAGATGSVLDVALLQVLGCALLGFAMLNWMNRHARIGGIFGRPIVVANLAHTGSAALLLAKIAADAPFSVPFALVVALYALLALAFGSKLFVGPREAA